MTHIIKRDIMDFSTIRIKQNIKEFIEVIAGKNKTSIANAVETIVESAIGNEDTQVHLSDTLFNNKISIEHCLKIEANVLQGFYWYWKRITPVDYQEKTSLIDFIGIYNFLSLDIASSIFTNTLNPTLFNEHEKNNINAFLFGQKFLFGSKTKEYLKIKEEIMQKFNPMELAGINKKYFMQLLLECINHKGYENLIQDSKIQKKIHELQDYTNYVAKTSNFDTNASSFEISQSTQTRDFRTKVIQLIESNYDLKYVDEALINDIFNILHNSSLTNSCDTFSEPYIQMLNISSIACKENEDLLDFEDHYTSYLCGNLGRESSTLTGCIDSVTARLKKKGPLYNYSSLEMSTRTPMLLINKLHEKRIAFLRSDIVKKALSEALPELISHIASKFSSSNAYWYEIKEPIETILNTSKTFSFNFTKSKEVIVNQYVGNSTISYSFTFNDFYKVALMIKDQSEFTKFKSYEFKDITLTLHPKGYLEEHMLLQLKLLRLYFENQELLSFKDLCNTILENKIFKEYTSANIRYMGIE